MIRLATPPLALKRFRRRRDLSALIDQYEGNFVRLMKLAPELEQLNGTSVSRVSGAVALYLTIVERHKYTTTINLTYLFKPPPNLTHSWSLEPDARICIYHDVRAVELISHCRRRRSRTLHPWRRGRMPEVDRKWEMNRFLSKWLRFCIHQGHLFLNCTVGSDPHFETLAHLHRRLPTL